MHVNATVDPPTTSNNPASNPVETGHPPTKQQTLDASLHQYYRSLVIAFWDQIQPDMWPQETYKFTQKHTDGILKLIWSDVFGSFQSQPSEKAASEQYMARLQQIQKAQAHARRHG